MVFLGRTKGHSLACTIDCLYCYCHFPEYTWYMRTFCIYKKMAEEQMRPKTDFRGTRLSVGVKWRWFAVSIAYFFLFIRYNNQNTYWRKRSRLLRAARTEGSIYNHSFEPPSIPKSHDQKQMHAGVVWCQKKFQYRLWQEAHHLSSKTVEHVLADRQKMSKRTTPAT